MIIRHAVYNDISQMVCLLSELFTIEDDFAIDAEKQSRGLERLIDTPSAIILVVEEGSDLIGMATLQTLISTAMGEYVGLIEDVIITQKFRGRGIGKILLEALIAQSDKAGLMRLAIGVDRRNHNAIAFYEKIGFSSSNMGLMYQIRR